MEFIMGLVAKRHQAFNPYSFQTIAREHKPTLSLSFTEQGPLSMVCSSRMVSPGGWRIGPNKECFIEASFTPKPFCLKILNDKWGTRPCFYLEDKEKFIFSSDFFALVKFLGDSVAIDEDAVAKYLSSGVLWGGQTFFDHIKMLPSQHQIIFDRREVVLEKLQSHSSDIERMTVQEKVQGLINCFEQSVNDWVKAYSVQEANLSGGADTRLILAALTLEQRSEITFVTDASPHLKNEDDQDVVIAKKLAEKFNLKHEIRNHNTFYKEKSFSIQDLPDNPKLSGNHGGEVLGLEIRHALEFYYESFHSDCSVETEKLLKNVDRLLTLDEDRSYQHGLNVLFQSFFTDIYNGGFLNDWSQPHQFIQRKLGPFRNSRLIDFVLELKDEFPHSYDLYAHLFLTYYPEFKEIPFNSVITHSRDDFMGLNSGADQKTTFIENKNVLSEVEVEKQNARVGVFCPEEFHRILHEKQDSILLQRCLKLNRWMDDLEVTAKRENLLQRLWAKIESAI
jgi:hypothetical protein